MRTAERRSLILNFIFSKKYSIYIHKLTSFIITIQVTILLKELINSHHKHDKTLKNLKSLEII